MTIHARCRSCGHRRKLDRHPDYYRTQPKCDRCGTRSWRKDIYRHRVELHQIRNGLGRYTRCGCAGHALVLTYPHRRGSKWCNYQANGDPKTLDQFQAEKKISEESRGNFAY